MTNKKIRLVDLERLQTELLNRKLRILGMIVFILVLLLLFDILISLISLLP